MGKGGIKAVFVIGTFIGIVIAVLKNFKLYDWIISKIIT